MECRDCFTINDFFKMTKNFKETTNASLDASINNRTAKNMKDSKQTRQETSGEVTLTNLDIVDVKGVIDAAIEQSLDRFSLFDQYWSKTPQTISLQQLLDKIVNDPVVRDNTLKCRHALAVGDTKGAETYKKMLPCFAPGCLLEGGHALKDIVQLTMKTYVDVDHIADEKLAEVVAAVRTDEHTYMGYITVRGHGVRVVCNIDFEGDEEDMQRLLDDSKYMKEQYTRAFLVTNEYYSKLVGMETDLKCKDPSHLSFIPHDPEVYINLKATPFRIKLEKKRPVGRPRKVPTAAEAEKFVEQTLKQQGTVFKHGDRNDYVYKAASEMNGYGVSEDDCIAWAVEKYEEKDFDREEITSTVHSAYTKVEEHGTKSFSAIIKKSQARTATMQEIRSYLEEQNVQTRRNDITRKYEIYDERKEVWRELTDRDENDLEYRLGEIYDKHIPKNFLCDIINSSFSPEFNPILDYFESLEYDGTDYFEEVANRIHVKGCTQEFHNHLLKKFLIWAIAGWLEPKVVNHVAYILVGPQRSYKTNLLRSLLPPQFSELRGELSFKGFITKDDELELASMMFIELDEFDTLSNKENALIRSLMTKDKVNKRAAYARNPENRLRIASFFGSTNNQNFLSDEYGNLRYMPFLIDYIDSPFDNKIDYDRFYGQLYHEYKSGFKYVLTKEEEEMLKVHNEDFEAISIEEENIQSYFRKPNEGESGEFYQKADVINYIRRYNPNLNLNPTRVLNILRKKYGYKKNGNRNSGYHGLLGAYLVPFTPNERKANRKGDTAEPVDNRPMDATECINLELPF